MSNSRVTNRELSQKLDELIVNVGECRLANEKRLVYLETCMEITKSDVDKLQKRSNIIDGATGLLAAIGVILGANK